MKSLKAQYVLYLLLAWTITAGTLFLLFYFFIGNSDFRKHKNKRMFAEHVLGHAVMGMAIRL